MKRRSLAVALLLATANAQPGLAGECGRWQASVSMVGDGAMMMNARACSDSHGQATDIQIHCDDIGLRIRIGLEIPPSAGDYTGLSQEFLFLAKGAEHRATLSYEALDDAFATSLQTSHPLIEMIRSGPELRISDPLGRLPEHQISLAGSRKAVDAVIATCP